MSVTKIVLSGDRDKARSYSVILKEELSSFGYKTLFVSEVEKDATTLCDALLGQLERESEALRMVEESEKALIICIGGAMDILCDIPVEERRAILDACSTNETECRDSYDGVFLVAHSGESYTKNVSVWTGTPHLRAVTDEKWLVRQLLSLLGEPRPLEIERKFLVEYPDVKKLQSLPECASVSISQTYLRGGEGEERRVRKRGTNGEYMYYLTTKSQGDGSVRTEIETRITKEQYECLKAEADSERGTVEKTRFCILYHQSYIEIDVYPFWSDRAIAEIELCSEDEEFEFPEYIKVIKEVTGNSEYKNSSLAKMLART